ncbi:MAG: hypothetical protein JWM16_5043 [Verrucomicrobiales bacterium]|nr:hypothetical protein [Verrucomicrobiales bacterium]
MGEDYSTELLGPAVYQAPQWAPEQENPPISVRAAERAATKALQEIVGDLKDWKRQDITLQQWSDSGHWIYRFSFNGPSYPSKRGTGQSTSSVLVFVLMNGQAVGPKKVVKTKS